MTVTLRRHLATHPGGAAARPRARVGLGAAPGRSGLRLCRRDRRASTRRPPTGSRAAEAINNSPAIVALYGPILDVTSAGELAMTKLTVLYAVFVASAVPRAGAPPHPHRGGVRSRRAARRHRRRPRRPARGRGARVGLVARRRSACWPRWRACAGGLPVTGSIAFAASWVGVSWVAVGITAVACQLSASARTCAALAGARASASSTCCGWSATPGPAGSRWLSPFGWSTRCVPGPTRAGGCCCSTSRSGSGARASPPSGCSQRPRPRVRAGGRPSRPRRWLAAARRRLRADLAGAPHHGLVLDRRRRRAWAW